MFINKSYHLRSMHGGLIAFAPPAGRAGFFVPSVQMKLKKSFALALRPLFSIGNILLNKDINIKGILFFCEWSI